MIDVFLRCAAAAIVSVLLILTLRGKNVEIATVLSLVCCCIIGVSAASILSPVLDFLGKLERISLIDPEMITTLLKIVGIGMISELTMAVCSDSGNAAIGKMVQIASTALILYLSLPLFTALLELLERIMGSI